MKRKPFFETVYRIWGVSTPEEKLAFWERVNGPTAGTDLSNLPIEKQLEMQEMGEYPRHEDEEDDEANWYPEEANIFLWKYCWERGIESSDKAMLRYFDFHHSGVLKDTQEDPNARLSLYKEVLVI